MLVEALGRESTWILLRGFPNLTRRGVYRLYGQDLWLED